jgi:hypothetical protein
MSLNVLGHVARQRRGQVIAQRSSTARHRPATRTRPRWAGPIGQELAQRIGVFDIASTACASRSKPRGTGSKPYGPEKQWNVRLLQVWRAAFKALRRTPWQCHHDPDIDVSDATVIRNGKTAMVFCTEHLGQVSLIATNTFVVEQGEWRMVHHQAAHLPG